VFSDYNTKKKKKGELSKPKFVVTDRGLHILNALGPPQL
jgi:hypothetical protein